MVKSRQQTARKPASKLAQLRKKMQKQRAGLKKQQARWQNQTGKKK